jgi:hypothetical protein
MDNLLGLVAPPMRLGSGRAGLGPFPARPSLVKLEGQNMQLVVALVLSMWASSANAWCDRDCVPGTLY